MAIITTRNINKYKPNGDYSSFCINYYTVSDLKRIKNRCLKVIADTDRIINNLNSVKSCYTNQYNKINELNELIKRYSYFTSLLYEVNRQLEQSAIKTCDYIYKNHADKTAKAQKIAQGIKDGVFR